MSNQLQYWLGIARTLNHEIIIIIIITLVIDAFFYICRVPSDLSSLESTTDGNSVVLGMVDGNLTVLTIADPKKPHMKVYLRQLPSRNPGRQIKEEEEEETEGDGEKKGEDGGGEGGEDGGEEQQQQEGEEEEKKKEEE